MNLKPCYPLGRYRGKAYARYFVRISQSSINDSLCWFVDVVAESPSAACNFVRNEIAHRLEYPAEIETAGPKGGRTYRFIGWESLIGAQMEQARPAWAQLALFSKAA